MKKRPGAGEEDVVHEHTPEATGRFLDRGVRRKADQDWTEVKSHGPGRAAIRCAKFEAGGAGAAIRATEAEAAGPSSAKSCLAEGPRLPSERALVPRLNSRPMAHMRHRL